MTDKQKGLIPAVQQVFPDSEHRFCVRHLYSNFQMHFKGENLKNQLWACARSSNVVQWNKNMKMMRELDSVGHKWLQQMPPQTWVRAFFSTYSKCDILLNNNCEVFNKYILDAREMPVLSMLEQIKSQLMTRHYNKGKEVGDLWDGPICPKIRKKLQKNTEFANICYALPAGKGVFEVQSKTNKYIVDIFLKKCDCRRWDLTGIPCSHAISCLRHERIPPESVVNECYSSASFMMAYGNTIWPCKDKSAWVKVDASEVLPPVYEKKVGRPPKSRRKQPYEIQGPSGPKLTKHGVIITCRYCGKSGHNRATCDLRKQRKESAGSALPDEEIPANSAGQGSSAGQASVGQEYADSALPDEEITHDEPIISQVSMFVDDTGGPLFSQLSSTMASQMMAESAQTRTIEAQPLPEPSFIMSNIPAARPMPPTTATKARRSRASKRKTNAPKKAKSPKKAKAPKNDA